MSDRISQGSDHNDDHGTPESYRDSAATNDETEGGSASGGTATASRKAIPAETIDAVILRSKRRCAMCYQFDQLLNEVKGQIAHVDRDNQNTDLDNLAYLCTKHHDEYDSRPSQTKRFLPVELKRWRSELYDTLDTYNHCLTLRINSHESCESEIYKFLAALKKKYDITVTVQSVFNGSWVVFLEADAENAERLNRLLDEDPQAIQRLLPPNAEAVTPDIKIAESLGRLASDHIPDEPDDPESIGRQSTVDWDQVIELYLKAVSRGPSGAGLWAGLGNAYVRKARLYGEENVTTAAALSRKGLNALCKAIQYSHHVRDDENDALLWTSYSVCLAEAGQTESALDAAQRAVELDPKSPVTWHNRIVLEANQDQFAIALELCTKALTHLVGDARNVIQQLRLHIEQEVRRSENGRGI